MGLGRHAPEVIRCYDGALHDALALNDSVAADELKNIWRKRARHWLGLDKKEEKRPTKRHRVKAFEVVNATDNILKKLTHYEKGWRSLEVDEAILADNPLNWPVLHWVTDHGSDMVSAFSFLQYHMKLNLVGTFDPLHACHDDFTHALRMTGSWCWALLMMVAWNLPYTPFDSGMRHIQATNAFEEYALAHPEGQCPLFQSYLDEIACDQGAEDSRLEDDFAIQMWERFRTSPIHDRRGRKVGMTRFLGMVFAAKDNIQDWTFQLLKWLYYGLQTGMLSKGRFASLFERKAASNIMS